MAPPAILPRAVAAADSVVIIVWQDRRRGASLTDIYAQSVAADGSVQATDVSGKLTLEKVRGLAIEHLGFAP